MIKTSVNIAIALLVIGFIHVSAEQSAQGQGLFQSRCCQKSCSPIRRGRVLRLFSHRGRCTTSSTLCCGTPMEGPCECVAPPAPGCGGGQGAGVDSNLSQDSGWVNGQDEDCQEQYDNCLKICKATCPGNLQTCLDFCECQRKVCQGQNLSCAAPACFDPNYQPTGPTPGGQ